MVLLKGFAFIPFRCLHDIIKGTTCSMHANNLGILKQLELPRQGALTPDSRGPIDPCPTWV